VVGAEDDEGPPDRRPGMHARRWSLNGPSWRSMRGSFDRPPPLPPTHPPPRLRRLLRNSQCLCGSGAPCTQRDRFTEHEVCRPSPRDFSGERVAEGRVRGCATPLLEQAVCDTSRRLCDPPHPPSAPSPPTKSVGGEGQHWRHSRRLSPAWCCMRAPHRAHNDP
jgi:hypothetical protein